METISLILSAFFGFVLGRLVHCYFKILVPKSWTKSLIAKYIPHHWITGLFFIIIGLIFYKESLGLLLIAFGIGLFISDFKDFLELKTTGPSRDDKKRKKKFWAID